MKDIRFLIVLIFSTISSAQIKGVVKDSITKEPIAYVSIWVENKNLGVTSEKDGSFEIETTEESNLLFSIIGYNNKTSKVNKDGIYYLSLKENIIEEVVVTSPLKTKTLEINDNSKEIYLPEPQQIPLLHARRFYLDEKNLDTKYIKEITYTTHSKVENGIFRVRIFGVTTEEMPGEDLIQEEIIVQVKKGKQKTKVDISKYNLSIPKEGIVVCFESLIVEQNMYLQEGRIVNTKKTVYNLNYSPHIYYKYSTKEVSYIYRTGKWVKQKRILYPNTKVYTPAINLTLTN